MKYIKRQIEAQMLEHSKFRTAILLWNMTSGLLLKLWKCRNLSALLPLFAFHRLSTKGKSMAPRDMMFFYLVSDGKLFVMGDNRVN